MFVIWPGRNQLVTYILANYKKEWYEENGEKKFEYKLIGPNKDKNKTKQLQDQGQEDQFIAY